MMPQSRIYPERAKLKQPAYLEELKNHVVEMRRNVGYLDWLGLVLCCSTEEKYQGM